MLTYREFYEGLPAHVHQLVMDGSYAPPSSHISTAFLDWFYDGYEDMLSGLQIGYLPLHFERDTLRFQLHPDFLNQAAPTQVAQYQRIFHMRYHQEFVEDESPDIEKDDSLFLGGLPYRISNETHAKRELCLLLGLPPASGGDDYGWIENRRQLFFQEMVELCQRYSLPRLPVTLDEVGARFQATQGEVTGFKALLQKRLVFDEMERVVEARYEAHRLAALQELSGEARNERLAVIQQERNDKMDEVSDVMENQWREENARHVFASQIDLYPAEVARHHRDHPEQCRRDDVPCLETVVPKGFNERLMTVQPG